MEQGIITYSAAIGACQKSGMRFRAVVLSVEMADGCFVWYTILGNTACTAGVKASKPWSLPWTSTPFGLTGEKKKKDRGVSGTVDLWDPHERLASGVPHIAVPCWQADSVWGSLVRGGRCSPLLRSVVFEGGALQCSALNPPEVSGKGWPV